MSLTATGEIATERLKNSRNGNPRYAVTLTVQIPNVGERYVNGKTASDSQFAYCMPTDGPAHCTWHVTPAGNVIFTDIRYVK